MKTILAMSFSLLFASSAFAATSLPQIGRDDAATIRWNQIVGVITALNVDNPVADIHAGATPWSVARGSARVNTATGRATFRVEGLVINGGKSSGTPGPISRVKGTLVCNAGEDTEEILDTDSVPLNVQGNATFLGSIASVPAVCENPLFLIRISVPEGAAGRWIATGAQRFIGRN